MISTALPSLGRFFRDFLESGTQNKNYYSFPTFGYSLSVGAFGQFAAMVLCVIEAAASFPPEYKHTHDDGTNERTSAAGFSALETTEDDTAGCYTQKEERHAPRE